MNTKQREIMLYKEFQDKYKNKLAFCYSMYDVELLNKQNGKHWFDASSKRFFNSRTQNDPPYAGCIFVSSEKMGYGYDRCYTIRAILKDGTIETVSPFQYYENRNTAHRHAMKLAEQIKQNK